MSLLGPDVSCSVSREENANGAYVLRFSAGAHSLPSCPSPSLIRSQGSVPEGPAGRRETERENKNELTSLFPACFFIPFETEMKLTHVLKHWPVETRSGPEMTGNRLFFSSHVPSVAVTCSFLTKACLQHCPVLLSSSCSCRFPQELAI